MPFPIVSDVQHAIKEIIDNAPSWELDLDDDDLSMITDYEETQPECHS